MSEDLERQAFEKQVFEKWKSDIRYEKEMVGDTGPVLAFRRCQSDELTWDAWSERFAYTQSWNPEGYYEDMIAIEREIPADAEKWES